MEQGHRGFAVYWLKELKDFTKTLPFNVKSLLLEHFG